MNRKRFNALAFLILLLSASFLSPGCTQSTAPESGAIVTPKPRQLGDSTIYALVAAGTNDSILVFLELPYTGADPDTVSILGAIMQRQVFGRPDVGDNVAIMRNAEDSTIADRVIVTEKLTAHWCYEVYPELRHKIGDGPLPERLQQMLDEPREYTMVIKSAGTMFIIGGRWRQEDEKLPVEYPIAKNYGRWELYNGRLLLSEVKRDSTGLATIVSTDTADFVRLGRDTLVLRFADGDERGYYRKEEIIEEVKEDVIEGGKEEV